MLMRPQSCNDTHAHLQFLPFVPYAVLCVSAHKYFREPPPESQRFHRSNVRACPTFQSSQHFLTCAHVLALGPCEPRFVVPPAHFNMYLSLCLSVTSHSPWCHIFITAMTSVFLRQRWKERFPKDVIPSITDPSFPHITLHSFSISI